MSDQFYTIGETADILGVTTKTLRNWDKDSSFRPDHRTGDHRRYSREVIEKKLGKKIENAQNPILSLDKERIDDLLWICGEPEKLDFNRLDGDTLREKYESLVLTLTKASMALYRKNGSCGANFLLTSPEIGPIFECCSASFSPNLSEAKRNKVIHSGLINARWNLYYTPLMEPQMMLLGYREDNKLYEDRDYMCSVWLDNMIL